MPIEVKHCPLCGAAESQLLDQREFRGEEIRNRVCSGCGLVFQSPRMTAAELDQFYAQAYRQVYQGESGPTKKDLFVQGGRADSLLAFLGEHNVKPSRHLDIGCSSGILLQRFRDHFGCEAIGVEPGDAYRAYAREKGLNVHPDLGSLQAAEEKRFDLISMAHVLEHIPDPVGYLADLREHHLTPSGLILLEVPNLYAHDSFEIAHMTSFSAHTLRQVIQHAGFELVALKRHGQPRSDILPLYLTVLARSSAQPDGQKAVVPERNVALKRRLGMLWRRVIQRLLPRRAWVPLPEA
jgi:2-polyprenyl-3-methyl-5-hydroxy-6-metoxy-1,4-benzoquinol methylase